MSYACSEIFCTQEKGTPTLHDKIVVEYVTRRTKKLNGDGVSWKKEKRSTPSKSVHRKNDEPDAVTFEWRSRLDGSA